MATERYPYLKIDENQTVCNLLSQDSDDKFKRAIDTLYNLHKEYIANSSIRMKQLIMSHKHKRGPKEHYGIPSKPYFLDKIKQVSHDTGYPLVKCVLVGDAVIGKSNIIITYTGARFAVEYVPTVFDNHSQNIIVDGKKISLGIWGKFVCD
jgi:hypothetical protein